MTSATRQSARPGASSSEGFPWQRALAAGRSADAVVHDWGDGLVYFSAAGARARGIEAMAAA